MFIGFGKLESTQLIWAVFLHSMYLGFQILHFEVTVTKNGQEPLWNQSIHIHVHTHMRIHRYMPKTSRGMLRMAQCLILSISRYQFRMILLSFSKVWSRTVDLKNACSWQDPSTPLTKVDNGCSVFQWEWDLNSRHLLIIRRNHWHCTFN